MERLPLLVRTGAGLAVLGIGASVIGSAVVGLLLVLGGIAPGDTGRTPLLLTSVGYVVFAVVVGCTWTALLQRRTILWLTAGRRPTEAEARRCLRLPLHICLVSGVLWFGGAVVVGGLAAVLAPGWPAIAITVAVLLGGLTTAGMTYLLAERVSRPLMVIALEVAPPSQVRSLSVLTRLVLTWGLVSATPFLGILVTIVLPTGDPDHPYAAVAVLGAVGLGVGGIATALLARSVAAPLLRMRTALQRIAAGRTDVAVPVDDSSEIGLLQNSINDMARGLREQERMRDLFGKHVGTEVARHALRNGATLDGEVRTVTALFVDVTGSTALAQRLPPQEIVRLLNRFFGVVVATVNANGGLVNKFAGDAALCVFGAPTAMPDAETAALRTARQIRDEVRRAGELDVGIGIATGQVFAGQLGSSERLEYTVIGDAVNEASRLSDQAKLVPGRVLASGVTTGAAAAGELAHWTENGHVTLRGRSAPTVTWTSS